MAVIKVDVCGMVDHCWQASDEWRANSHLKAAECWNPVLVLIS
jgi:hypothetical protein